MIFLPINKKQLKDKVQILAKLVAHMYIKTEVGEYSVTVVAHIPVV